jgi:type II secretory pathway pseudopilin PulG
MKAIAVRTAPASPPPPSQRTGFTLIERPAVRLRRRCAFTLIELLTVVAIIIILTGLVLGVGTYSKQKAFQAKARAEMQHLQNALQEFKMDEGYYPLAGQLGKDKGSGGKTVIDRLPPALQNRYRAGDGQLPDPWSGGDNDTKHVYVYRYDAKNPEAYTLYCRGPNADDSATEDDIWPGK